MESKGMQHCLIFCSGEPQRQNSTNRNWNFLRSKKYKYTIHSYNFASNRIIYLRVKIVHRDGLDMLQEWLSTQCQEDYRKLRWVEEHPDHIYICICMKCCKPEVTNPQHTKGKVICKCLNLGLEFCFLTNCFRQFINTEKYCHKLSKYWPMEIDCRGCKDLQARGD
jgi:hypothetical protein